MNAKRCTLSLTAIVLLSLTAAAEEFRGVVVKVDAKNHELVVDGRGRRLHGSELAFMLDKETQIQIGNQSIKVDALTLGKRVRVVYEMQAGERVAVRVTVLGGGATAPAAPAGVKPPADDSNTVSGVLRRLALTDREIVLIKANPSGGPELERTVFVTETAKINREQKPIRFEDLKEGEQVVVVAEKQDGWLLAKSIQAGPAAAANATGNMPKAPGSGAEKARRILRIIEGFLDNYDRP